MRAHCPIGETSGSGPPRTEAPSASGSALRALAVAGTLFALAPMLVACAALPHAPPAQQEEPNDPLRSYSVRRSLLDARIYRDQGRLEAALRTTSRGLAVAPDDPRLHRLHADLLSDLGRKEEAAKHRARADTLSPPLPPLPETALEIEGAGRLLVLLLPPPAEDDPAFPSRVERIPREWPDASVAGILRERLALRLPAARVELLDRSRLENEFGSVEAVRGFLEEHRRTGVLTIRVDRAFCGRSPEQGDWAVAWLRLAFGTPGPGSAPLDTLRRIVERPASCKSEVIARALEDAFARPSFERLARAPDAGASWSRSSIRALFPDLGLAIAREIDAGRRQLAGGNLGAAQEHFLRAAAIDPGDLDASTYLEEVQLALALFRELDGPAARNATQAHEEAGAAEASQHSSATTEHLRPELREAEIRALRRRLGEEHARRDELIAALAVLYDSARPPSSDTIAVLRPSEIRDPEALGPRLARSQAGTDVEARVLFAPDGSVVARYYFEATRSDPLLREEDGDGDGRPDLWTAYSNNARHEIWQDDAGLGTPNLHVIFSEDGVSVEQVEIDADSNGVMERRFIYQAGRLYREQRDTTGDGQLDCEEQYAEDGSLAVREEDLDGDSEFDIRTLYRAGRMFSREILNPAAVGAGAHP